MIASCVHTAVSRSTLELPSVEVDAEEKKVRSAVEKRNRLTRKRCIIILRDVPFDALESEVSNLFVNEHCPIPAIECEKVLETVGGSGCWYVTFNSEDDAQNAFLYLTRENVSIRGHKVLVSLVSHPHEYNASFVSFRLE